jgi:hypothetical protein
MPLALSARARRARGGILRTGFGGGARVQGGRNGATKDELARRPRHTLSGRQRSLREISAELAARGFVAERTGRPYQAAQVSRVLAEDK